MKKPGCCTLCEKEVFEVKQRFTEAPLERWPRFVGRPAEEAMRLTFTLSDGSEADITFCRECAKTAHDRFDEIWRICTDAAWFENENRAAFGARDDKATRDRGAFDIAWHENMSIAALKRSEPWFDTLKRERTGKRERAG